ncbi:pantoate--beta-alanine ligase [Candidatus Omnitrophota bacterium]
MRVIKTINAMQSQIKKLKQQNKTIGFVPTMGALHAGHASLIQKCRRECDIVVLSIFINPTQFGKGEDFNKYPREEKKDKLFSKKLNVDIIFYPTEKMMYPSGFLTTINVTEMDRNLCGKFRPEHFRGVTTVVGKLLNIVAADFLYLGQKDAQQALIIKRMIEDLNFDITLKICPTVREADGLALSSRNVYLKLAERRQAPLLYLTLKQARAKIKNGEKKATTITRWITNQIKTQTSGNVEYVECVKATDLTVQKLINGKTLIAIAVKFGKTRLIDNIII